MSIIKNDLTKDDILNYLIDCIGYCPDDLLNQSLADMVANLSNAQLSDCLQYNNK
jgi:hypothetical protein